jgi:hypothetical protein
MVCAILLILFWAPLAIAQDLGEREQWQPQTENDPLLQQPVHFEILGRAAVPTLSMLSEQTGVSLGVAPENLDSLGERKVTIISKGLTLKAIMVHLCEALQECHWDVDASGEQPVYLLHRSPGMNDAAEREARVRAEAGRPWREAVLAEVRRALAMPPEELTKLEQSDLLMAHACRGRFFRAQMEALVALPAMAMEELLRTGSVTIAYSGSASSLQAAADAVVGRYVFGPGGGGGGPETEAFYQTYETPSIWQLSYQMADHPSRTVTLGVAAPVGSQLRGLAEGIIVPPHDIPPGERWPSWPYRAILEDTGVPKDEARRILQARLDKANKAWRESSSLAQRLPRDEPSNPLLRARLSLEGGKYDPVPFLQFEQIIARKTDLSIVSDYFLGHGQVLPSDVLHQELTLWQLLHLVCPGQHYLWKDAGPCLVFHHEYWAEMAQQEIPEAVIADVRERLRQPGTPTLRDLAEISARLADKQRDGWYRWPVDCRFVGMEDADWALSLYRTLSPEQEQEALSICGLLFSEMTLAQQRQARARAEAFVPPVPESALPNVAFHIRATSPHRWRLWLQFGERQDPVSVAYDAPRPHTSPSG